MENFGLALNKIKQPKPDIEAVDNNKRIIYNPYVGIINDINPTSTPIGDILELKKTQMPKGKFNLYNNKIKKGLINLNNFLTTGIIACSTLALISLFKKK